MVRRWALWFAIAGILLALAPLGGTYVDPGFPAAFYPLALWASLCIFLFVGVCWALQILGNWLERDVTEQFRAAKRDELQELVPFYDRVVGGDRPSINELKEIFNANNQVFRFLEKVVKQGHKKKTNILGFCTVVPMNRDSEALLEQEELNGLRMNKTHIVPPGRPSRTIYIGSIGGEGSKAKAAVLNYVLGLIDDCAARGVQTIYPRPVTTDGLRVAKKHGFKPVNDNCGPDELRRLYRLQLEGRFDRQTRRKPRARREAGANVHS